MYLIQYTLLKGLHMRAQFKDNLLDLTGNGWRACGTCLPLTLVSNYHGVVDRLVCGESIGCTELSTGYETDTH